MPCFCFCPDTIGISPNSLKLLAAWLLQAAAVTIPPSASGAKLIFGGGQWPTLRARAGGFSFHGPGLRFISPIQLALACSASSQRLTGSARLALNVTNSLDLPTALLKLGKIARTSSSFVLPHASKLALLSPIAMAKLALAAQLIKAIRDQGLNPFSRSTARQLIPSIRGGALSLRLPKASINLASVLPINPILAIVSLTLKRGCDPFNPIDLRLTGNHLARFGSSGVRLAFGFSTALRIATALNLVALLQDIFGERLFLSDPSAWQRVIDYLRQFTRAFANLIPTIPGLTVPSFRATGPDLNANFRSTNEGRWLRTAGRISVLAALNASIRASASLNASFINTETSIALTQSLSAALGFAPSINCCGRCGI